MPAANPPRRLEVSNAERSRAALDLAERVAPGPTAEHTLTLIHEQGGSSRGAAPYASASLRASWIPAPGRDPPRPPVRCRRGREQLRAARVLLRRSRPDRQRPLATARLREAMRTTYATSAAASRASRVAMRQRCAGPCSATARNLNWSWTLGRLPGHFGLKCADALRFATLPLARRTRRSGASAIR
jgi:hypothetical protein